MSYPDERHGLVGHERNLFSAPPPPYKDYDSTPLAPRASKWNPKSWTRKTLLIVLGVGILALIILIVAIYFGVHNNSYPDYSPLQYQLQDTFAGSDFFDDFEYFTGYDPTYGFVHYVPRETAMSPQYNLTYADADSAVLKVDTTEQNADTGRFSVRITSKKQYNSGLFVFDILNTPYGCSTWPALWLTDPANWPENGMLANHPADASKLQLTQP